MQQVLNIETSNAVLTVTPFVLISADTDQDVLELTEGKEVNLSTLSLNNFNIRADASANTSGQLLSQKSAVGY